ncbi:antitoxin MazE7 [Streptomyces sp. 2A115]|uniref:antitoxin MazE7 n=1 Tax=Streptomyces sp. 2A115 TaxID=3457439 RepID=UPI003FD46824
MAELEIDDTTRDTLQDLAADAGLSVPDYLAKVAEEKKRERALDAGAAIFRRVTGDPATVAAFDAEFGGPTSAPHGARQAA